MFDHLVSGSTCFILMWKEQGCAFLLTHSYSKNNVIAAAVVNVDKLLSIINWVVRALNADWLKAVVYQTVCHVLTLVCFSMVRA